MGNGTNLLAPPATAPVGGPPRRPPTAIRIHKRPQTVLKFSVERRAEILTLAVLQFQNSIKKRFKFLIPRDSVAWLDHLISIIKKHTETKYLGDKEILQIIRVWRATNATKVILGQNSKPVFDPDLPQCHSWTPAQVGEWLDFIGYPQYKEAFINNNISGKKLVNVDATSLNKIGIQYFTDIKDIATKIRDLLKIHRPNIFRALLRIVPFQKYLEYRAKTGLAYNSTTFESFCTKFGFPYEALRKNKCALIACVCEVLIQKVGASSYYELSSQYSTATTMATSESSSSDDSNLSLHLAPSVEYTVRHQIVRNRVVQDILDTLLLAVFDTSQRKEVYRASLVETIRELIIWGQEQLFSRDEIIKRLQFARCIADEILRETRNSCKVLQDIKEFQQHMIKAFKGKKWNKKDLEEVKELAEVFVEEVASIATMLAYGELELENIFRQDPEINKFVDEIIQTAEERTNEQVSVAEELLGDVVKEARLRLLMMEFPGLSMEEIDDIKVFAEELLDEMLDDTFEFVEYLEQHEGVPPPPPEGQDSNIEEGFTSESSAKDTDTGSSSISKGQEDANRQAKGKRQINQKEQQKLKFGAWKNMKTGGRDPTTAELSAGETSTEAEEEEEYTTDFEKDGTTRARMSSQGPRATELGEATPEFDHRAGDQSTTDSTDTSTGATNRAIDLRSTKSNFLEQLQRAEMAMEDTKSTDDDDLDRSSVYQFEKEYEEELKLQQQLGMLGEPRQGQGPAEGFPRTQKGKLTKKTTAEDGEEKPRHSVLLNKDDQQRLDELRQKLRERRIQKQLENSYAIEDTVKVFEGTSEGFIFQQYESTVGEWSGSGDGISPSDQAEITTDDKLSTETETKIKSPSQTKLNKSKHRDSKEKRDRSKPKRRRHKKGEPDSNSSSDESDINAKTPSRHPSVRRIPKDVSVVARHRIEIAERWASTNEPEVVRKTKKLDETTKDRAKVIRNMADQVVGDVVQMALTHLLLKAEAGQDTQKIIKALNELQVSGTGTVGQVRLWTPQLDHPPSPSTTEERPPIQPQFLPGAQQGQHLQQQQAQCENRVRAHRERIECPPITKCPSDMVCFYPYFQPWKKF